MKLVIEINTDNDAFRFDPKFEVGRIIKWLAESIRLAGVPLDQLESFPLADINGNSVGTATFERDVLDMKDDGRCPHCGVDLMDGDEVINVGWVQPCSGTGTLGRRPDGTLVYFGEAEPESADYSHFTCGSCGNGIFLPEHKEEWS